ncbi:hypothetical protein TNIN_415451 [Trichonephila inaurata madagascariensis]|uniref:Uncharacterized protein n=1 Tax=Trichonephila inaurata madagascariensis TaxID=2747483 RepID=A0A8X6YIJ9_9ARAC|nr:hypothetical protein TNIN_415451 [Trichonephila inaurata madagascariensis]
MTQNDRVEWVPLPEFEEPHSKENIETETAMEWIPRQTNGVPPQHIQVFLTPTKQYKMEIIPDHRSGSPMKPKVSIKHPFMEELTVIRMDGG